MKMIIYLLLSATMLLAGCNSGSENTDSDGEGNLNVSFVCPESETVDMNSRVLNPQQEKNIRDLNIYMYHRETGICKRQYLTGAMSFSIPLNFGVWDIYVIGNYGFDMGNKTKVEIENLRYSILSESDLERNSLMPMSGRQEVNISGNASISITLKRIVAKIDVSVNVTGAAIGNITLNTISLINIPSESGYFGTNSPYSGMINYSSRNITNGQSVSFYMLENRQGVNNSISHQKYKGGENSPANASYLHIKGKSGRNELDYYIYLGENNTTDFNVINNKNYSLIINIQGLSETDWRVKVTDTRNIDVMLTAAELSRISYYPELHFVGSDNKMSVTIILSRPPQHSLDIRISGILNRQGSRVTLADDMFFRDAYITVPAFQTIGYGTFYRDLREGLDNLSSLTFNECKITGYRRNPNDDNNYNYVSGYVPVKVVSDDMVNAYPPA